MEKRCSFELFKSNVCHWLKEEGDIDFLIQVLESDLIRKYCDTPTHVLTNGRGFLRHGGTPQRTFTSPLHPVTGLPLSRLLGGFLF